MTKLACSIDWFLCRTTHPCWKIWKKMVQTQSTYLNHCPCASLANYKTGCFGRKPAHTCHQNWYRLPSWALLDRTSDFLQFCMRSHKEHFQHAFSNLSRVALALQSNRSHRLNHSNWFACMWRLMRKDLPDRNFLQRIWSQWLGILDLLLRLYRSKQTDRSRLLKKVCKASSLMDIP